MPTKTILFIATRMRQGNRKISIIEKLLNNKIAEYCNCWCKAVTLCTYDQARINRRRGRVNHCFLGGTLKSGIFCNVTYIILALQLLWCNKETLLYYCTGERNFVVILGHQIFKYGPVYDRMLARDVIKGGWLHRVHHDDINSISSDYDYDVRVMQPSSAQKIMDVPMSRAAFLNQCVATQ